MIPIPHRDWRHEPAVLAERLRISEEAVALYQSADVIDGHLDSFIWSRLFGYDLFQRHGAGLFGRHFYSQVDFPRALEAGLTGGVWVITTNILKPARLRRRTFFRNLAQLRELFAEAEPIEHVRSASEYRRARAAGKHGAFIGVQGGNALDHDITDIERIPEGDVLRCTLVHLTSSSLGATSSPASVVGPRGLTDTGRAFVEALNAAKIFVDLAHIGRRAFDDVLAVHDHTQPLMVTHTGVCGVYDHWRNLTDAQIRAIADSGGCVGVMFQQSFLGPGEVDAKTIVRHLEHIIAVSNEDVPCIGTDYDGAISPPPDLATPLALPRLVQAMLDRGWSPTRVRKVLGDNFLRVVEALRG